MARTQRQQFDRFRWVLPSVALAAALAYASWDSVEGARHILTISAGYGVTVDAPAVNARSATGYEKGVRSLVLPPTAADTAHWLMQTQGMFARGEWRVRHVDYDNAHQGRDVHWGSPVHWWLAAIAWLDHVITGRPLGIAVERATLVAGPLLFAALVPGIAWALCRWFSATAAALVVLGCAATFPFYLDFTPGHAGHHAAVNICCLATVLLMLVGCFRVPDPAAVDTDSAGPQPEQERRAVRRWFIGSALAGALGLWISAATTVPVMVGIGLGILAATWLARKAGGRIAWLRDPTLLRLWGFVGAGASLLAYLVEYFPTHLAMRLEVNHPLYALAWAGAGEALQLATRAIGWGMRSLKRSELARALLAGAAVAVLPVVIALTAPGTFVVADPFVWRLHRDFILEFRSLASLAAPSNFDWSWVALVTPTLWLLPPLGLLALRSTPPEARAGLGLALAPALVTQVLGWSQIRWLGLAFALSVPAIALFFRILEKPGRARRATPAIWACLCGLALLSGAVRSVQRTLGRAQVSADDVHLLAQRDAAHLLRQRCGDEPVVVASGPNATSILIFHGGLAGLGTLYWENAAGLKNAAALFAAPSEEAARTIVERSGVTHIVFLSWEAFEFTLVKLARGLPNRSPVPPDSFIARLLADRVPPTWLRPVAFPLPDYPAFAGQEVRIWEVSPGQTPSEAAANAAVYWLELDKPEVAQQYVPTLTAFKGDLAAGAALGLVTFERDAAVFSAALNNVTSQLDRAESLPLEHHLRVVIVLAQGGRLDLAKTQLQSCMQKVNEPGLRRLTPNSVSNLLALADQLGVALPDSSLRHLAEHLLSPTMRQ